MNRATCAIAISLAAGMLAVLALVSGSQTRSVAVGTPTKSYQPLGMRVVSDSFVAPTDRKICIILQSYIPVQSIQLAAASDPEQLSSFFNNGRLYDVAAKGLLFASNGRTEVVMFGLGSQYQCLLYHFSRSTNPFGTLKIAAINQDNYILVDDSQIGGSV